MENSPIIREIVFSSPLLLGCLFIPYFDLSTFAYFTFTMTMICCSVFLFILEISPNFNKFKNKNELFFHVFKNISFGIFLFLTSKYIMLKKFGLFYTLSWLLACIFKAFFNNDLNYGYSYNNYKNGIIYKNLDLNIYYKPTKKPVIILKKIKVYKIEKKKKKASIITNENSFMLEKKIKPKNVVKRAFSISLIYKQKKIFNLFRVESLFISSIKKENQISRENSFQIIHENQNINLLNGCFSRISINNNYSNLNSNNNNNWNGPFLFQNSNLNSSNAFSNYSNSNNPLNNFSFSEQDTFHESFRERERHQIIVHRTTYGNKYHRGNCGYLHSSNYEITLQKAKELGLTACFRCRPPS